jgi:hypothetical protein
VAIPAFLRRGVSSVCNDDAEPTVAADGNVGPDARAPLHSQWRRRRLPYICTVSAKCASRSCSCVNRGGPVDRYELANRAALVGDLRIEEVRDDKLRRYVRMARLVNVLRPREREALATLYDPKLIAMSPLAFTLSGFERIGEQDLAQSWLVRFA